MFLEELKRRLDFLPTSEKQSILSSYEEQLFNARSAAEEEKLLESFGSIDSIVQKYEREHEITEIAGTSQSELPSLNATADLKAILSEEGFVGSAKEYINEKDIIIEDNSSDIKTKTFSEKSRPRAGGGPIVLDDLTPTNPVETPSEEFVPSPEAEQTGCNPYIEEDDYEEYDGQQVINIEENESIFAIIIKRLNVSRGAAPFIFILLLLVSLPIVLIMLSVALIIYAAAYAVLGAVILAVMLIAFAFIALGVVGLVNAIVTLFKQIPLGILEIGLSTIAFAAAIAVLAISYQLIFGVVASVSRFITVKFKSVLRKIKSFILGSISKNKLN